VQLDHPAALPGRPDRRNRVVEVGEKTFGAV
jgi:hypothetical protein